MRIVIDRFEDSYAICEWEEEGENPRILQLKRGCLPVTAKEGDVLTQRDNCYIVDQVETDKRKRENLDLLESLFEEEP